MSQPRTQQPASSRRPNESSRGRTRSRPSDRGHRPNRYAVWAIAAVAAAVAVLYLGLPAIPGIDETWGRLSKGDPWSLALAAVCEAASYGAYIFAFHGVFSGPRSRIGWRESAQICLAGVAATRVLAAGGAGGVALNVWALEHSRMRGHEVVRRLTTFYVSIYVPFVAALVIAGVGLRTGVLSGPAPFGLTVVPAILGTAALVLAVGTTAAPSDLGERVGRRSNRAGKVAGWAATLAQGVRGAGTLVRARDRALLGTLGWWAFDIATLVACFHAFGDVPPGGVVVMAYLVGQLGNVLPLPGGIGGVEGGLIGALLAFHVAAGLAVAAVLGYRAFSFWLPTVPGAIAYVRLRRTVSRWDRESRGEPVRHDGDEEDP